MELRYFGSVLWRFKVLFVLLTLVGAQAGFLLLQRGAVQYRAVSTLLVRPSTLSTGGSAYVEPQRYIAGEIRFLTGTEFLSRVAAETGQEQSTEYELLPVQNTDIVDIRATARSAEAAVKAANTFAEQYLEVLLERTEVQEVEEPEFVTEGLKSISDELAKLTARLTRTPNDGAALAAQQALLAQYGDLLRTRTSLRLGQTFVVNTQVVERAETGRPLEARSSFVSLMSILLLAGLFVAGLLIALSRASSRVFAPAQLQELDPNAPIISFPRLAAPPGLRSIGISIPGKVLQPLRNLTRRVQTSLSASDTLSVAVLSLERESAVTTVSTLLASNLGRNGDRVVLADLNLSNQRLTEEFDARGGRLLGPLVKGATRSASSGQLDPVLESDLNRCLTATNMTGVSVIGELGAVLNRTLVRSTTHAMSAGQDSLVMDCSAVVDSTITVQIATIADVIVIVVPLRRTRMRSLRDLIDQLGDRRIVFVTVPASLVKRPKEKAA